MLWEKVEVKKWLLICKLIYLSVLQVYVYNKLIYNISVPLKSGQVKY